MPSAQSAAAAALGVELQRVATEAPVAPAAAGWAPSWQHVLSELEANAREHLRTTAALQLDATGPVRVRVGVRASYPNPKPNPNPNPSPNPSPSPNPNQGGLSAELRLPVQLYWHQVRARGFV